jgi:poly-gamma-glutamate capsule biosynthesis protein CapA/YwtB (metallophosphatase superfamily)
MSLTIAFLGDTLLGHLYRGLLRERGYAYPFERLAPLLARADLTVANHEGALATRRRGQRDTRQRDRYWMRADPESAAALAAHGVRVVSLANNHVLDYGHEGLAETIATLDEYGIAHCGAGADEEAARRPVVIAANGVRVGFVSCIQSYELYEGWLYADGAAGGCSRLREGTLSADLERLDRLADLRVVLVHWGRNYRPVTPVQERWAPRMRVAGADLVIGHHPHIAQRVHLLDGCPIVYSLGNGPFGTSGRFVERAQAPYGLLALAEIDGAGRLTTLELYLIDVDNQKTGFRPTPVQDEGAVAFLRSLTSAEHGWYERDHALRLELPPP